MGEFLPMAERPWPGGRPTHRGRQVPRNAGSRGRGVSGRQISTVRGTLLPQCIFLCPAYRKVTGDQDAQNDPYPREQTTAHAKEWDIMTTLREMKPLEAAKKVEYEQEEKLAYTPFFLSSGHRYA